MSKQANYFKIGLFIIVGAGLLLAGVVVLSTAALFEDTVTVETYFAESVQGLSEGSAVKFRGVQIGQVERIMFTHNKYTYEEDVPLSERKPYVLVEFSVAPEALGATRGEPMGRILSQMVEHGLRVTLGYQGLTGLAYLELDVKKPRDQHPRLEVDWTTPDRYIPSHPSTIAQVNESLQSIMTTVEEIGDVPFAQIGQGVDDLLQRLNSIEDDAEVGRAMQKAIKLLDDSEVVVARVRSLLETEGVAGIPRDAAVAVARARRLMEEAGRDVPKLLEELKKTTTMLEAAAEKVDTLLADERIDAGLGDAAAAAEDLRQATKEMPETVAELRSALEDASRMIERREDDVRELMREMQSIARNLSRLSEEVRRDPSRLLFGDPPPQWEELEE